MHICERILSHVTYMQMSVRVELMTMNDHDGRQMCVCVCVCARARVCVQDFEAKQSYCIFKNGFM